MEQLVAHASSPNSSQDKSTFSVDPLVTDNGSKFSEMFTSASLLELCSSFWMRSPSARNDVQPYLRGCKWSPDGTCCLSVVNHDGFHIMELPQDLYEGYPTTDRMITLLPAVIHVKESGLVYDFCWYPKMNSHYPETCSWISTKINSPIQMWDAYDGSLRCSYRGFNAVDEMEPALSVTFINEGQRIVGGYKNCLRTFDVERPGRDFLQHKIQSSASCFATYGNLLAVGSWNANIKLFSILDNGTYKSVGNLYAHTGGITHLQFTPDGSKLVSGARKDNNLCVWDVRYHRRPLNILKRSVSTNQRIYFDISKCGRYLVSGGTDGVVRVWDNKFTKWSEQFNVKHGDQENATFRFPLYRDCCNSISIHPSRPILATGSGQFHFLDPVKILELECDSATNCEDSAIVETHSASNGSSSDEQALIETPDVLFTEIHNTDVETELEIHTHVVSENIPSEVQVMDSTNEFIDKNANKDVAEVYPPKLIPLDTSNEPPPAKKIKMSTDTNSTIVKQIVETETLSIPTVETFNISTSNLVHIHEEPPIIQDNLNAPNQPSTEVSNIAEATVNLNELGERDIVSIKEPNLSSIEEAQRSSDLATLSVSSTFDNPTPRVLKVGIDSQFSKELPKLSDSNKSPTKMATVRHLEKTPDSKYIGGKVLKSGDVNDINENKMKYSPNAENNLTFWWIA